MFRRIVFALVIASLVLAGAACGKNKNVKNPLAQVDSKQPDKVLFDRAMEAMKSRKYDVARLSLQTLINTYPDSEDVARAKLAIGDSWLAEGGSTAWAQAESEYKDFQTFFPNMPEAAEAQLKIADIHYKQMEKPDRDYTHAKRAEDEYRQLLLQYPDSKLADEAKKKLLEVQEVLAEREFRIGRFYYLRESWAASIARLKSVTDTYPLYSHADEALMMLGDAYEAEANIIRAAKLNDASKQKLIKSFEDSAAAAYTKIVTRYPAMPRFADAKAKLAAMDRPVPTPTQEAIAQNKKEMEGREELGKFDSVMSNFKKRPLAAIAAAPKVGDPTLVDPKQTDAPELVREANDIMTSGMTGGAAGKNKVSVETVKDGKVPESEAVPRSDSGNGSATTTGDQPAQPPAQVNEAAQPSDSSNAATTSSSTSSSSDAKATSDSKSSSDSSKNNDENSSSSRKKKKSGLRKIVPF